MIFLVSIVVPPPEVTFTPEVAAYNSNVTFTCTVISLTQPTITWSTNATNNNIPGSTTTSQGNTYTSTLVLNGVTLDSIGRYTCNVTNNEGGSNTADVLFFVTGKDLMLIYISYILYILHSCAFFKILFLMIVVACVHSMMYMYMYSIIRKMYSLAMSASVHTKWVGTNKWRLLTEI